MIAASQGTPRNVAILIAAVMFIGWLLYLIFNLRRAKPEIGSEIELAPNRRPYYDDDVLETRHLEHVQLWGLAMLVIIAIGLPLYWIREPGREAGATAGFVKRFASQGGELFAPTSEGGFNCSGCHGGMKAAGGQAAYTITDPRTGQIRVVSWKAPALNTVLSRFSADEVTYIITYGRPFSPMQPWGLAGGGPMNDQQISNLVAYLKSIQIQPDTDPATGAAVPNADNQKTITEQLAAAMATGKYASEGEALFNLAYASGAYSCARCHTAGWSFDDPQISGGGAMGPNLTNGAEPRQFPNVEDQVAFVKGGSDTGKKYGQQGQGSGKMPGFGTLLTDEQIRAIVAYERGL